MPRQQSSSLLGCGQREWAPPRPPPLAPPSADLPPLQSPALSAPCRARRSQTACGARAVRQPAAHQGILPERRHTHAAAGAAERCGNQQPARCASRAAAAAAAPLPTATAHHWRPSSTAAAAAGSGAALQVSTAGMSTASGSRPMLVHVSPSSSAIPPSNRLSLPPVALSLCIALLIWPGASPSPSLCRPLLLRPPEPHFDS